MGTPLDAAARSLAAGDPLGALKRVALLEDPHALALRGIAMAQLGELARAQQLLRRAERGFGAAQPLLRARCILAQTEIALAARELRARPAALRWALEVLQARGDAVNLAYARLLAIRRGLLLGHTADAERALCALRLDGAPARLAATAELMRAELALRRLAAREAERALARARKAAQRAGIPALVHEVEKLASQLSAPVARVYARGKVRALAIAELDGVLRSGALIVDGCRRSARGRKLDVDLRGRPVLFALLRVLAERWPAVAPRDELMRTAFAVRNPNESHRARLRVELGRLRVLLRSLAEIRAQAGGYALAPSAAREVVVLLPPSDGHDSALLALLADGQRWSTSALALALSTSQRHVQRTLADLERAGKVHAHGRGRSQRWSAPSAAFTPTMLLPVGLPIG